MQVYHILIYHNQKKKALEDWKKSNKEELEKLRGKYLNK